MHDARQGHRQVHILVKAPEEAAQFSRRRVTISLDSLADETEALLPRASPIDTFDGNLQPKDGGGMGRDHLDDAGVEPRRHGPGAEAAQGAFGGNGTEAMGR